MVFGTLADVADQEGWTLAEQRAMEAELQRGWNAVKAMEKHRMVEAAKEAQALRDMRHERAGLLRGKCVLTLPQWEYEALCEKYGQEAFEERGFIKDMQRHCPETKVCDA